MNWKVNMKGLILAGGYSTRMGMDKSKIVYHEKPQYQFLLDLLHSHEIEAFVSCRPDQDFENNIPVIQDKYTDIGPLAGVLSAFEFNSGVSWLVIACDLPFVTDQVIAHLTQHRDIHKQATFFLDANTLKPEPLLTIYEPSVFALLKAAYDRKQYSLNKILQQCDGNGLEPLHPEWLKNVNTKEEM